MRPRRRKTVNPKRKTSSPAAQKRKRRRLRRQPNRTTTFALALCTCHPSAREGFYKGIASPAVLLDCIVGEDRLVRLDGNTGEVIAIWMWTNTCLRRFHFRDGHFPPAE